MELKIGRVTASDGIIRETYETEDFQVFCMSCVRRHRSGDWGDVPKDIWIENNHIARNGGELTSAYKIPVIFCLGYADKILVRTNEKRTETKILFEEEG